MPDRPAALLAAIVFVGYLGVSRGVGDLYPFSTFSMYARRGGAAVSRVAARTADGRAREVRAFTGWSCDGPIDVSKARCEALGAFDGDYQDAEDVAHIEAHRARQGDERGVDGVEPVDLVRRVWRLRDEPGPPAIEDCHLHRCSARRVEP